jgi:hypothetical protein
MYRCVRTVNDSDTGHTVEHAKGSMSKIHPAVSCRGSPISSRLLYDAHRGQFLVRLSRVIESRGEEVLPAPAMGMRRLFQQLHPTSSGIRKRGVPDRPSSCHSTAAHRAFVPQLCDPVIVCCLPHHPVHALDSLLPGLSQPRLARTKVPLNDTV